MRDVRYVLKFLNSFAIEDRPGVSIAKAPYHESKYCTCCIVCEAYNGRHQAQVAMRYCASPP